jgi:chaperone required for assembly of F1-ATPase
LILHFKKILIDVVAEVRLFLTRYRTTEPPEFSDLQKKEWEPVVEWLRSRYSIAVHQTCYALF